MTFEDFNDECEEIIEEHGEGVLVDLEEIENGGSRTWECELWRWVNWLKKVKADPIEIARQEKNNPLAWNTRRKNIGNFVIFDDYEALPILSIKVTKTL